MSANRTVGKCRLVYNSSFGEWIVKVWDQDGVRWFGADYYTTDKTDAEKTMDLMLRKSDQSD